MKKTLFFVQSAVLFLFAAMAVPSISEASQSRLSENFSQFDQGTGFPTDATIVQCSASHEPPSTAASTQSNLYEGAIAEWDQNHTPSSERAVAPGFSAVRSSDGTGRVYENEILNRLPPSSNLSESYIIVGEGRVVVSTAYGETVLQAVKGMTDFENKNIAKISYGAPIPLNSPEMAAFKGSSARLSDVMFVGLSPGQVAAQTVRSRTISNFDDILIADNRSGLGDGTNPGQGGGRENSSNSGVNNPDQANA
ncbi:MAG TPA: hypothetical protein VL404_05380 [Candidatus Eisenbacteria bacterium]|jgi:hypothetical protein|nr:hypothetical protein [Candidatus Eisenbacteria bacterium]